MTGNDVIDEELREIFYNFVAKGQDQDVFEIGQCLYIVYVVC